MEKSESIKELAAALSKAQGDFGGAKKDSINPHLKSKYADLASVVDAIKSSLAKHGLSFVQISHDALGIASIETVILHSSGEFLSAGTVSVPAQKNDAQGYGSAMTYARRYSLSAAFGIAPEEDDGEAAKKTVKSERLPACAEEKFTSLCADKINAETGEIEKMGIKSLVQSSQRQPADILSSLQTRFTLTAEQIATVESWGTK